MGFARWVESGDAHVRRKGQILAACLLITFGSLHASHAGPLDSSMVPPEAAWSLHVDVELARESTLAAPLMALAPDRPAQAMMSVLRGLGLDPASDVLGITLYGIDASDGVTVVTCTRAADALALAIPDSPLPKYVFDTINTQAVHSWGKENARWVASLVPVKTHDKQRVVVIASDLARLRRGLDVLAGSRSAPGDEPSLMMPDRPRAGSMVYLRLESEKLRQAEEGLFRSELFQQASFVTLDIGVIPPAEGDEPGPSNSVAYAEGHAKANTPEAAGLWERAIQVLLGLGGNQGEEHAWAHAARSASVWADGTTVRFSFRQDVDRVAATFGKGDTGLAAMKPRTGESSTVAAPNVVVSEGK